MKALLLSTALALLLCGCAGVPKTKVRFGDFKLDSPKQIELTNLVANVDTNGHLRVTLGSLISKNDPDVIAQVGANQVRQMEQINTMLQRLTELAKQVGEAYGSLQTGGVLK